MNRLTVLLKLRYAQLVVFFVLACVIIGTGLRPGYLFLLDMPWPENLYLGRELLENAKPHTPILALLSLLNIVVPSWLLQKLVLLSILVAAGTGVFMLSKYLHGRTALAYISGMLAVLNPFVAERLMAGQWLVLAGYAYAPFVIASLLRLLHSPTKSTFVRFTVLYAVFPIISLHWWYMTTPLLIALYLARNWRKIKQQVVPIAIVAGVVIIVNSFWVASIAGTNGTLQTITAKDFEAFRTATDPTMGPLMQVLSLHGFWQDSFNQPKVYFAGWWLYGLLTIIAAIHGVARSKEDRNRVFARVYLAIIPIIILLAIGYATPFTTQLTELVQMAPGYVGLRETAKLIGLVAIFVALFAPVALRNSSTKLLMVMPLAILVAMNGMLIGLRGYLQTYDYPQSYAQVATTIEQVYEPIVVLPWSGYMNLNYADNAYVANPASNYFAAADLVVSNRTGNGFLDGKPNELDGILLRPDQSDWAQKLKQSGYNYVLLLKTDSWKNYRAGLASAEILYESNEISFYRL